MRNILKILVSILTILTLFTACGGKYQDLGNTYNKDTDYPIFFNNLSFHGMIVTPAENGYYLRVQDFLFYTDKSTMNTTILCNKPNCKHENEEDPYEVWKCNGYSYVDNCPMMQVYEGKLYLTQVAREDKSLMPKTHLYRYELDGSAGEKILEELPSDGRLLIHRGYIYISEMIYDTHDKYKRSAKVYRYNMDNLKSEPEVIFESDNYNAQIELKAYGNKLYITDIGIPQKGDGDIIKQYTYDILTKKIESLLGQAEGDKKSIDILSITYNNIFYKKYEYWILDNEDIGKCYISDLEGKNTVLYNNCIDDGNYAYGTLFADNDYYYEVWMPNNTRSDYDENKEEFKNKERLVVKDKNKKELMSFDLNEAHGENTHLIIGDENMFLIEYFTDYFPIVYYINKAEIKAGSASIKTLCDFSDINMRPPTSK